MAFSTARVAPGSIRGAARTDGRLDAAAARRRRRSRAGRSCPGEADQELARASASDPAGRTFVMGKDSDYHVFEGCRYIQFGSIEVGGETPAGSLRGGGWGGEERMSSPI